jgi:hypothetical protein
MKKVLITLPNHDIATYYISSWSKEIIKEAEKRNISTLKLEGNKANRKNLISFLEKQDPGFIILNGHGDENSIYGYKEEVLIKVGDEEMLRNKIIYTIACDAAKFLGESIVEKGEKCFIGYKDKFVFFMDERKVTKPLDDDKAASFFNPANLVPISIIKGNKTIESVEKARDAFKKEIIKWRMSKELEAIFMVSALLHDFSSLTHLGKDSSFE